MKASDLPELERRLAELADAFGSRHPTKGALRVWMDALAECELADVLAVLTDWPKSHVRPPVPAEVLRVARERASERIERRAANQRNEPAPIFRGNPKSAAYRAFRNSIRALTQGKRPSKDWAVKLLRRYEEGEKVPAICVEMATNAIGRRQMKEDDDGWE